MLKSGSRQTKSPHAPPFIRDSINCFTLNMVIYICRISSFLRKYDAWDRYDIQYLIDYVKQ